MTLRTGLPNLTTLDLGNNQLTGSIPGELGNLSALTSLNLPSNRLTGSIPAEFEGLSALTHLSLFSNQLTGVEPGALGGLRSIQAVDLGDNGPPQDAVDAAIAQVYEARETCEVAGIKILFIGGDNSIPGPTALAQVAELETNHQWNISHSGEQKTPFMPVLLGGEARHGCEFEGRFTNAPSQALPR